jgi:hypothetical protein
MKREITQRLGSQWEALGSDLVFHSVVPESQSPFQLTNDQLTNPMFSLISSSGTAAAATATSFDFTISPTDDFIKFDMLDTQLDSSNLTQDDAAPFFQSSMLLQQQQLPPTSSSSSSSSVMLQSTDDESSVWILRFRQRFLVQIDFSIMNLHDTLVRGMI